MYSLPSLHDPLPLLLRERFTGTEGAAGLLHEDDWLQCEFRAVSAWVETEQLVTSGREFAETHRVGIGYREVFTVRSPDRPLCPGLTVESLTRASRVPEVGSLFLKCGGESGRVRDGFIVLLPDVGYVYGAAPGGSVIALGLALIGPAPQEVDLASLVGVAKGFGLELVDWQRFERINAADEQVLRAWIRRVAESEAAA